MTEPCLQELGEGLQTFRDSWFEFEFQGLQWLECLGMALGQVLTVTLSTPSFPDLPGLPLCGSGSSRGVDSPAGPISVTQVPKRH